MRLDRALTEWTLVLLLEPGFNALSVEHVPHVARQWRNHGLFLVLWILRELIKANRTLNNMLEHIWTEFFGD